MERKLLEFLLPTRIVNQKSKAIIRIAEVTTIIKYLNDAEVFILITSPFTSSI